MSHRTYDCPCDSTQCCEKCCSYCEKVAAEASTPRRELETLANEIFDAIDNDGITQWLSRAYFVGVARRIIDRAIATPPAPCPNCETLKADVYEMQQSIHYDECSDENCKEPVCAKFLRDAEAAQSVKEKGE